jgi:hypothetical protein
LNLTGTVRALTLLVWTRPIGLVVLTVTVVVVLLIAATRLVAEVGRRAEGVEQSLPNLASAQR